MNVSKPASCVQHILTMIFFNLIEDLFVSNAHVETLQYARLYRVK